MKKGAFFWPYRIWMWIFIVLPLLLVLYYAFTVDAGTSRVFSLDNFRQMLDPVYLRVLWRSLWMAGLSTLLCFLIGYPLAMILASKEYSHKFWLIILFILPMWMNMLLRTYAWMSILEDNGLLNMLFGAVGLGPYTMLYTSGSVIVGMVYNYLPFMVLPIYAVLCKIDRAVIEAAEDLGADAFTVFRRITFPLSMPGVRSGFIMVFMPAISTFVISRLLGGGHYTLIGNLIEREYVYTGNWGFGSALSAVLMLLILISMIFNKDKDGEGGVFG